MPHWIWIVLGCAALYGVYRVGRRNRWIEPHCYCRGDQPGHACLNECWHGRRGRSSAYQEHMRRPAWLRWLYTAR